jgi:hypothetical protein
MTFHSLLRGLVGVQQMQVVVDASVERLKESLHEEKGEKPRLLVSAMFRHFS